VNERRWLQRPVRLSSTTLPMIDPLSRCAINPSGILL
jgi:hypothetical protein